MHPDRPIPVLAGVMSESQVIATAHSIARVQHADGAIPCYAPGTGGVGPTDPWDHIEAAMAMTAAGLVDPAARAYQWLRDQQRPDGSWPAQWIGTAVTDHAGHANHAAYVATGVWHHHLIVADAAFLEAMWPTVQRAIGYVLQLQQPAGQVAWLREPDGRTNDLALLTGCSSIYHALRSAAAIADHLGQPQPAWELAADRLREAITTRPDLFADRSRFSMDWYYPVLAGVVRGHRALQRINQRWDVFVHQGMGCRCVHDEPWITGAETGELVIALTCVGEQERALQLFSDIQMLRHPDGSYWTGYQYHHQRHFPADRSTYTAAAVILAADALTGTTPAAAVFPRPDQPVTVHLGDDHDQRTASAATSTTLRHLDARR